MREIYPNELYHYGVLGMKWGVRRYQPYSQVPRGSGKGGKENGEARKTGRLERKASKYDRMAQKNAEARAKNRSKIESKQNAKIEKYKQQNSSDLVEVQKNYKKAKLSDFDAGTKAVQTGYKYASDVIRNYDAARTRAKSDKSFKKTDEYRTAARNYTNQVLLEAYGGRPYAVFEYAHNQIVYGSPEYPQRKRD